MRSFAEHQSVRHWLQEPAPRWLLASLAAVILAIPAWMLQDELRSFFLFNDDFVYVAQSRDWPTTSAHLLEPHNAHVVPIFRLWTFVLVSVSGGLANLPVVFAAAGYFALVSAMLALGHLVTRETGQPAAGLSAMAVLGLSTVTHPTVTWFSAGQALWAGTAILVTIALAQSWSEKGGSRRLAAVALATLAAPLVWTGGLLAGPAAIAYLASKKAVRFRAAAIVLAASTLTSISLLLVISHRHIRDSPLVWETRRDVWPRPIQALLHTAQALVEVCLCGNLGLDVTTTPSQAVALLFALAVLFAWSRSGRARWSALEASGATITLGSCLLVFFVRGNQPYSSLRVLSWYNTIPQIGTILFFSGWWISLTAKPPEAPRTSLGQASAVFVLAFVCCVIQIPRATNQLIKLAPPMPSNEAGLFPSTALLAGRARYFKIEFHDRQRRALARLDRLDALLSELNASPESLRDVFGHATVPGLSEKLLSCDAFSLLTQRPRDADALPSLAEKSALLIELLSPEPEPAPPWLSPKHPASPIKTDNHARQD